MKTPAASLVAASALCTETSLERALRQACRHVRANLPGPPDLAILFVSSAYSEGLDSAARVACSLLETEQLIGCTGESIIGVGREVEMAPAVSLWAACLPDARVTPFHLTFEQTSEGGAILGWPEELIGDWPADASLFLLGDPFSFPANVLLARLGEDRPGVTVAGGMASSGFQPGQSRIFVGSQTKGEGAAAALVSGGVRLRHLVSQGCRPIGRPFVVTKAERNVILSLGGKPPLEQLQAVYQELPTREQRLVSQALHVGRVVNELQDRFEQGDFLVRNVVGADRETGAIALADFIRAGQTVQFHIRDAETAHAELSDLLAKLHKQSPAPPRGALLFTCNGRGTRLFSQPHHDAGCVRKYFGDMPVAGFFAHGEIGPVGGTSFLHGFTASLAFFYDGDSGEAS